MGLLIHPPLLKVVSPSLQLWCRTSRENLIIFCVCHRESSKLHPQLHLLGSSSSCCLAAFHMGGRSPLWRVPLWDFRLLWDIYRKLSTGPYHKDCMTTVGQAEGSADKTSHRGNIQSRGPPKLRAGGKEKENIQGKGLSDWGAGTLSVQKFTLIGVNADLRKGVGCVSGKRRSHSVQKDHDGQLGELAVGSHPWLPSTNTTRGMIC